MIGKLWLQKPSIATTLTIGMDVSGTGMYSKFYEYKGPEYFTFRDKSATQTTVDNSITRTGTYKRSNSASGARDDIEFTTETKVIEGRMRRQTGVIVRDEITGSYAATQNISYNLTGVIIDESSMCEPISGIVTNDQGIAYVAMTTIAKEINDQHWKFSIANGVANTG